jgi:hypothetical protein
MVQGNTRITTVHNGWFEDPGGRQVDAVDRDWRDRAVCRSVDPETFFPVGDDGPPFDAQVTQAKAVCARCPVVAECLTFARVALPEGIAGGLTAAERRMVGATRRCCPCGTPLPVNSVNSRKYCSPACPTASEIRRQQQLTVARRRRARPHRTRPQRPCKQCGAVFTPGRDSQVHCTGACREQATRAARVERGRVNRLLTGCTR